MTEQVKPNLAIGCVVTGDYMPHAANLFDSLKRTNPEVQFIVLVLGEKQRLTLERSVGPEWLFWDELYDAEERAAMLHKYTAFELSCATRARLHEYMWQKSGATKWIVLDTDMLILASLSPIWDALDASTAILTPHSQSRHRIPAEEVESIRSGIYNAGFLAMRKCEESLALIQWFKERIESLGYGSLHRAVSGMKPDPYGCLYVDQIWLNFMPVLFAGVNSSGPPHWNLGHWNLDDGDLQGSEHEGYTFNGKRVLIAHFSAIDPEHPEYVSKHAPRFRESPNPTWAAMASPYLESLAQARAASKEIGYCYADQSAAAKEEEAGQQNHQPSNRRQKLRHILARIKQTARKPLRLMPKSVRGVLRAGIVQPLRAIRKAPATITDTLFANKSTDNFLGIVKCMGTYEVYTVRTAIADHLRKACPNFHGVVLDVGAGSAPYRELITAQPGVKKYIRLDFADSNYHSGNELEMTWDGNVIGLPDGSVDSVLLTEVLEHVRHPGKLLAEIARVMKANGFLFLTVPFIWPLHELPFDYYRYTPIAMRELLEEQGFIDIEIQMMGGWDTSLAQMLGLYLTNRPMGLHTRRMLQLMAWPIYNMLVEHGRKETMALVNHQMYSGMAAKAWLGTPAANL